MAPDKLRSVIAEAEALGVSIVMIAGGEPLTRPEVLDIAAEHPGIVVREPFSFRSLREDATFDFTVYDVYAPCPIDRVHQEVKAS